MVNNPKLFSIKSGQRATSESHVSVNSDIGNTNPQISAIDTSISEIDISRSSLYPFKVNLDWDQKNEIDLSRFPNLTKLDCSNNNLSKLDLSHTPRLTELRCYNNRLEKLDLSFTPQLELLHCGGVTR